MKHLFFLITSVSILITGLQAQDKADIDYQQNTLTIRYGGQQLFSGKLNSGASPVRILQHQQIINNASYQLISINAENGNVLELIGNITAGDESIACESAAPDNALKVVRHVVGPSHNLLNNAVYSRKNDWLLSFDVNITTAIIKPADNNRFDFTVKGREIIIRFLPKYYQKHRGLSYFEPSQYSTWKKPVVGWCSWFAYLDTVKESDIHKTADVLSSKLLPFGLDYLQIDDGYEQTPIGFPDTWIKPNKKFPSGLKSLAEYIESKGLKPGIWTNVSFADSTTAYNRSNLFVKNVNGLPAYGNWIGYVMDGNNPKTIEELITPVYKTLKSDGFAYLKLDALRHLKYEGYNSNAGYFTDKKAGRNDAFRNIVKSVRKEMGKDHFLLACWGIRPELVGLVDGCRIGNDGFSYAGLAQFNSYNNIVWRNDPDHIVLSEKEAFRSCTATSLTGSVFMLTDQPDKYNNTFLTDAARHSIPVLYTQPGQVYDVDPSKSAKIDLSDAEISGSGPRPFDASSTTTTGLFSLEINKPFENWIVLGRLDERDKVIRFKDLGLDDKKEYLVFEFWTKKLKALAKQQFEPGTIDSLYRCQAFAIREKQNHPQLLATSRHISCGALELNQLEWKKRALNGNCELIAGDTYSLYIYEPDDYDLTSLDISNADILKSTKDGKVRTVTFLSQQGGNVSWSLGYRQ